MTEEYSFSYDSLGRLIRSMELGADGTVKQRTQHLYDTANRLTSQSWTVGNDTYTESDTYYSGDGSLKAVTTAAGDKRTYAENAGQKRLPASQKGLQAIALPRTKNAGNCAFRYK